MSVSGRRRILSGIQPTSGLTLGNYLGAIKGWVQRQADNENFLFIANLHVHTVPQDPAELRKNTLELAALYLACGLDPSKCTMFVQSQVRAHAEAAWLLTCITPLGWLEKMTQFKDKSAKQESVRTGLLTYPTLMAADILLYQPDEVPVGEDQKQHVELTRNVAERFNHLFGPTFKIPEPRIPQIGARIMGLDNPLAKMSKSSAHIPGHAVLLTDEPAAIMKAFKGATTDSGREIRFSDDPAKAGVNNLLSIYQVITGKSKHQCEKDFETARGYGDLKVAVAETVIAELNPIREAYGKLIADQAELERTLRRSAEHASAVADQTLAAMKDRMGILR